jgi:hypothetical protein
MALSLRIRSINKVEDQNIISPLVYKLSVQQKFTETNLKKGESRTIVGYYYNGISMINIMEWKWVCPGTASCNNASGYGITGGCLANGSSCPDNNYTGLLEYMESKSGNYKGNASFDYKVNADVFWYVNGKREGNVTLGFKTTIKAGDTCHFKIEPHEDYDQIDGTIQLISSAGTN